MSILTLLLPFFLFAALFLLQIVLVQFYRPKSEDAFIFQLYLTLPIVLVALYLLFPWHSAITRRDLLYAYPLLFFICSSWIASYPAVYAACPTLAITYFIKRNNGASEAELEMHLHLKENSLERVSDAYKNGLIVSEGKNIKLTRQGRIMLWAFSTYRTLIGRKMSPL